MATKKTAFIALFLSLNLLTSTVVSDCGSSCTLPYPNYPICPPSAPVPPSYPRPPAPTFPRPPPPTIPVPPPPATCPRDALQLGVCANVLNGLLGIIIGSPPVEPCCSLLQGLLDIEAALCLCTAINANILGINLNVQIALTLLLNVCSREVPPGFVCA